MSHGTLYVFSAPSGAGKTSLVNAVRAADARIAISVSHTTRHQRPGEQDGQDYHFVSPAAFEDKVAKGEFLEFARVFDYHYGTARASVDALLSQGLDVILEIDWQGARQIREILPDCVSVFILPPSRSALEQRLRQRGQDEEQVIARRMRDATAEMTHYAEYDYVIINDDFAAALEDILVILRARRLERSHLDTRARALIDALLSA